MKLRIEVELTDEDLKAFVGYHEVVYGHRGHPFGAPRKLRKDLENALASRAEYWHKTVEDDRKVGGEEQWHQD